MESPIRDRDVLPLPTGQHCRAELAGYARVRDLSAGNRRRAREQRWQERWMLQGVEALNQLGGEGRSVKADAPRST
eukprot:9946162-Heterocapsa_arctica.AAC.1